MRELVIENGIVIDDVDSVVEGIRNITGKKLSDAETIRKFITTEKATKYYIDKKCTGKMQPDRDTVYLWLDSGYTDRYGDSIMISLLGDNFGKYTGHYFGTMDCLARNIKSYFPKNSKDISRNLNNLKSKYQTKIADREHPHIDNEQEYLIMLCNSDSCASEIEYMINSLDIRFEDLAKEPEETVTEIPETKENPAPGADMTKKEEQITISFLFDLLDEERAHNKELLEELKKYEKDKERLQELLQKNRELEQALVDIRSFKEQHMTEPEESKEISCGHDLLGRRGKILVLGASAISPKEMNGIAKQYGFKKEDFSYEVDYDKIKAFSGRAGMLTKYSAVILGACPHKVQNLGDWSSLIEKCKNTEGMPIAIDARSRSGELKVTKESFREALLEITKQL